MTFSALGGGDMLDIASNSVLKTSCTMSHTSVADTRKWLEATLKLKTTLSLGLKHAKKD